MAARAQRRTKSSFIEWAVAESLSQVPLPEVISYEFSSGGEQSISIQQKAGQLWHVDEADRVVALALIAPALLTHDEQLIWKLVKENGYVWRGHFDAQNEWRWDLSESTLIRDRLRDFWESFKAVAAGELETSALPKWQKTKAPDHFEDDIPF